PLAAVVAVLEAGHGVAPVAAAELGGEDRALRVVEQQEVDLVRELVLDDAPREAAGVEERRVEVDLAGLGVRAADRRDVNRDRAGEDAPVEARGAERGA